MKILLQRVSKASVTVGDKCIGEIEAGLLIFLGVGKEDRVDSVPAAAKKIANLRIFSNPEGKFDYSLLDIEGQALVISQFTLFADTSKGRRPEFFDAMEPRGAKELYLKFGEELKALGVKRVETGQFGAMMDVTLVNDGPVTLLLEL